MKRTFQILAILVSASLIAACAGPAEEKAEETKEESNQTPEETKSEGEENK